MANDNTMFIPEIWSQKILKNFDAKSVMIANNLVNTDYEGEIKEKGDTVKVKQFGDVTVKDYTGSISVDDVSGSESQLDIDVEKYFAFKIGDVEEVQSDTNLINGYSERAGVAQANNTDALLLAEADSCLAGNIIGEDGTPIVLTKTNVIKYILQLGLALNKASCPKDGRYMVIPPEMEYILKDSTLNVASTMGDDSSVLRTDSIGTLGGFEFFPSQNIKMTGGGGDVFNIACGVREYLSYANQINKLRAVVMEAEFSTQISGLNVFGYKVFTQYKKLGACLKAQITVA